MQLYQFVKNRNKKLFNHQMRVKMYFAPNLILELFRCHTISVLNVYLENSDFSRKSLLSHV